MRASRSPVKQRRSKLLPARVTAVPAGYPTLIFKKASGETMPYDGERDVESMVAFIKDNADADVKVEL